MLAARRWLYSPRWLSGSRKLVVQAKLGCQVGFEARFDGWRSSVLWKWSIVLSRPAGGSLAMDTETIQMIYQVRVRSFMHLSTDVKEISADARSQARHGLLITFCGMFCT